MQNIAPTFHDSSKEITAIGNNVSGGANNIASAFANTKQLTVPQFVSLIGIIAGIATLHHIDKIAAQSHESKPVDAIIASMGNEALKAKDNFIMWKDTRFNTQNEESFGKAIEASVLIAKRNKKTAMIASID